MFEKKVRVSRSGEREKTDDSLLEVFFDLVGVSTTHDIYFLHSRYCQELQSVLDQRNVHQRQ
jgi:hypothetical protein